MTDWSPEQTELESDLEYSTDARDVVIRRMVRELANRPDLSLTPLQVDRLDGRDARLAQAIYIECLRHLLTIEYLIDSRLDRDFSNLEAKMQAALLVGATQILFFDSLPDHAVVNETVNWAGEHIRPKARGLVNAILRRVIEMRGDVFESANASLNDAKLASAIPRSDGRFIEIRGVEWPGDRIARRGVLTSHPVDLVRRWSRTFRSAGDLDRLLLHNLAHPPTVLAGLPADVQDERLMAHETSGLHVWTGSHDSLSTFLAEHPGARVQDAGSYTVVESTRDLDLAGALVCDLCAGSGTKTAHLANVHPRSRILATDPDARRFEMLQTRFAEIDHVEVIETDRLIDFAGQVQLVLTDVPCSNTGVLARRIEAKYRVDRAHLQSLVDLQRQILVDAIRLCAPGSSILYSTCSLEREENEQQIAWLAQWHSMRARSQDLVKPSGLPAESATRYRDGSYHALVSAL